MELFKLFGTIGLNGVEQTQKDIRDTTDQAESGGDKMSAAFKKIGTAVATYLTIDTIKRFGQAVVEASANVSAEVSAYEQIMGDYTDNATKKMNEVADATGVVNSRLTPYMTSLTAKFKGLGYDIDTATTLATDGLTLASDAAAFWDKSLDESVSHLNSFVNGSYEGGEAIGLFANDTQMAAYAVRQGIVSETKAWAALDEATKQATRLEYAKLMFEQSGATGQAAKEANQYANVQANLTEKWRQFKAQVGEPVLQNIVLPAMSKLSELVDKASLAFQNAQPWIETVKSTVSEMGQYWNTNVAPAIQLVADSLGNFTGKIMEFLPQIELSKSPTDYMKMAFDLLTGALNFVAGAIDNVSNWLGIVKQKLEEAKTWADNNQTALTLMGIAIGTVTAAIIAYNSAAIIKKALDIAETAQIYLLVAADYAHAAASAVATGATTAFGAAVAFLTSPITLVIAAIGAFIAIGVLLWKNWDTIKVKASELMSSVVSRFTAIKNSASQIFSSIYNSIKDKIGAARDFVKGAIDKIKGFFKFSVSLPKIKLPHFSISPSGWQIGDLLKGKIPKLGISWYKSAMDNPVILDSPTIFGEANGQLLGGGEAGAEVVAGRDTLMGMIQNAVNTANARNTEIMEKLLSLLATYIPDIATRNTRLLLDTGVLVGEIAPAIDRELGSISRMKERGR